jgi:hypothetical protein
MNQLDALTTMLDATVELDDRPHVRRARKVLAKMAEARRAKRERRLQRDIFPHAWPHTQLDCPECGTAGTFRGASTNRDRWVALMRCPFCLGSWERLQEPGTLTVLAKLPVPTEIGTTGGSGAEGIGS